MAEDLRALSDRIRNLLDAYDGDAGMPPRSTVEPTLTEGYARALELDAECLRLERRIDRVTRALADGHNSRADELPELLSRLREAESQVVELRALLAPLRRLVAKAA